MKGGDNMNTFQDNDVVECLPNDKYSKLFNGQGIVTSADITATKYVWVDWHYGFGMVAKKDLKLADDQTKVIYKK